MKDYVYLSKPRILSYVDTSWLITMDLLNLVGKVYYLCRVKTIRIAASSVMDSWNGRN